MMHAEGELDLWILSPNRDYGLLAFNFICSAYTWAPVRVVLRNRAVETARVSAL